jgi:glycosyltransferase involved in cell wall biosynthesis
MTCYRIGFVLEQALGHITHSRNLRANVPLDPEVQAFWRLIPFEATGLAARIPVFKSNWTVRAGLRARRAVAGMAGMANLDALFFHTQVPAVLATDWLRRIPGVISLDATPLQYDSLGQFYDHQAGPFLLEHVKWRLQRDSFHAARRLVTWSRWAREGLVRDYAVPEEKVTVIPPGVNSVEWTRSAPRTPHDGPVKILFVGGDLKRKGGLLLLDAFRTLRAEAPVELHLVTREPVSAEPGLFVYTQMQPNSPELKQLYHASDIFCLPSYGDCLPMVLSEAGAAGLPAVSTQVAAIPEVVRDGETGLLVPAGDTAALTLALRRLVHNAGLRLSLGHAAAALVAAEYDAVRNTRRLLDLLKQVADTAHSPVCCTYTPAPKQGLQRQHAPEKNLL